jgi:protein gp37
LAEEERERAERLQKALQARAAGPKFISAEPLLADLGTDLDLSGISQIIARGESGWHLRDAAIRTWRGMADPPLGKPMAIKGWTPRPDRIDWMRHLRDFCQAQGAAYFLKQWGRIIPDSAGHILDGREWSEQPRVPGDNDRWRE